MFPTKYQCKDNQKHREGNVCIFQQSTPLNMNTEVCGALLATD